MYFIHAFEFVHLRAENNTQVVVWRICSSLAPLKRQQVVIDIIIIYPEPDDRRNQQQYRREYCII